MQGMNSSVVFQLHQNGIISLPLDISYPPSSFIERDEVHNFSSSRRLSTEERSTIAPLYRGFGTHFAFIWVKLFYIKFLIQTYLAYCFYRLDRHLSASLLLWILEAITQRFLAMDATVESIWTLYLILKSLQLQRYLRNRKFKC